MQRVETLVDTAPVLRLEGGSCMEPGTLEKSCGEATLPFFMELLQEDVR